MMTGPQRGMRRSRLVPVHRSLQYKNFAADRQFNEQRVHRLRDIGHDYRDLVTAIKNPDFTANLVEIDSAEDRRCYDEKKLCFQEPLRWLRYLCSLKQINRKARLAFDPPAALALAEPAPSTSIYLTFKAKKCDIFSVYGLPSMLARDVALWCFNALGL